MNDLLYFLTEFGVYILSIIILLIIIRNLISNLFKEYHSNWNTLIDNFEYSTEEFYIKFRKELLSHGVSGISASDVSLREGNLFSSRRRYIRIKWKDFQYDICAAPFGNGFFISWWLLYKNSIGKFLISKIPFIGTWLARIWFPVTYYKIDTASMFMTYAQSSVLKVIEDITNNKGVRALTENERKPILNNIFKR